MMLAAAGVGGLGTALEVEPRLPPPAPKWAASDYMYAIGMFPGAVIAKVLGVKLGGEGAPGPDLLIFGGISAVVWLYILSKVLPGSGGKA